MHSQVCKLRVKKRRKGRKKERHGRPLENDTATESKEDGSEDDLLLDVLDVEEESVAMEVALLRKHAGARTAPKPVFDVREILFRCSLALFPCCLCLARESSKGRYFLIITG